jgi:hypothetical protein
MWPGGLMKLTNGGASWAASYGGDCGGNTSRVEAIAIQASSPTASTPVMNVR